MRIEKQVGKKIIWLLLIGLSLLATMSKILVGFDIDENSKTEIREYFKFMYERNFLENIYADKWQDCIKHWLIDYAKETNQNWELLEERL